MKPKLKCRVYWGSHGCRKRRGHWFGHRCDRGCTKPYKGRKTNFYGEDAPKNETG